MIEVLRAEIAARVEANHPFIVVEALERLLGDMRTNMAECSYYFNFNTYWRLRSRITQLMRMHTFDYDDSWAIGEVGRRLHATMKTADDLRLKRYEHVCGRCNACQTRRRQWPSHTVFKVGSPAALTSLLN